MLVPAEQESYMLQMIPPTVPQLANLDNEMSRILNLSNEPADVKLKRYNQVLRRYMHLQDFSTDKEVQLTKEDTTPPSRRPAVNESLPIAEAPAAPAPLPFTDDSILYGIPSRNLNAARQLLHYMKRNNHLKWNEQGEMIVEGERYPSTNIVDLVHDFSRFRKSMNPPAGYLAFARALKTQNVPRETIGNRERWRLLEDIGNVTMPFEQSALGPSTSTPIRFTRSPSMRSSRNSTASNLTWHEFSPNQTPRQNN